MAISTFFNNVAQQVAHVFEANPWAHNWRLALAQTVSKIAMLASALLAYTAYLNGMNEMKWGCIVFFAASSYASLALRKLYLSTAPAPENKIERKRTMT